MMLMVCLNQKKMFDYERSEAGFELSVGRVFCRVLGRLVRT